jgi:dUTP pyrophosphatase
MRGQKPTVEIIYSDNYDFEKWGPLVPATEGAAGFDVRACACTDVIVAPGSTVKIDLGIKLHINDPHLAAMLIPRSGLGVKGLVLGNTIGLIDSDYQGPVVAAVFNRLQKEDHMFYDSWYKNENNIVIHPGDRIAQLIFLPVIIPTLFKVNHFEETRRGEGGFGHTGVGD